jgi:circadian clock protein KaiC
MDEPVTEKPPRLKTGVPGFDEVLEGGFVEGAAYIIQGEPGAGKTILANQIAFSALGEGRRVLYVTLLAESHERLFQALGTLEFFDKSKLGSEIIYISVFQTLRDEGLSAVASLLRRETARHKATLLIFDGLLNARDRADTELNVKTFVAELQGQAAFVNCTILFLASSRLSEENPEHTMVDGVIDLRHEIIGVRSIRRLQVKKSRATGALGGYHEFGITHAGVAIYPRLERLLRYPSVPDRISDALVTSGVRGLDPLVGGGLRSGTVTLVFGPSGSGKTSFGLSFLRAASADEPALHFGFYETPARLALKANSIGVPLEQTMEAGHLEILWHPVTENLLDKLGADLLEAVARRKVKRLFIDGLGGFVRAAAYPPRLVEFFTALSNELRARDVTTLATWEMHELFGPTVAAPGHEMSGMVDNLIMLRPVELNSEIRRVLSVLKIRDCSHETRLHEVVMGNEGLEVGVHLDPASDVATGVAKTVQV